MGDLLKRKALVAELTSQFHEQPNPCSPLHEKALQYWETDQFDPALRCVDESYQLALRTGDSYARAVSRLYAGLTLFMQKEAHYWDKAAACCEESAALFHGMQDREAEGVAWLAVGRIADAMQEAGYNRMERALSAYLKVIAPEAETPEELIGIAEKFRDEAIERLGQKKGTAKPTPTSSNLATAVTHRAPGAATGAAASAAPSSQSATPGAPAAPTTSAGPGAAPHQHPSVGNQPAAQSTRGAAQTTQRKPAAKNRTLALLGYVEIALVATAVILLIGLVVYLFVSWLLENSQMVQWLVVVACIALGLALVPLALIARAGQLIYSLSQTSAAVVERQGTWSVVTQPGRRLLLPFMEQIRVLFPRTLRKVATQVPGQALSGGTAANANITARYDIELPDRTWAHVCAFAKPGQFLGIPRPVALAASGSLADEYACELLREALVKVASELEPSRPLLAGKILNEQVCVRLAAQCDSSGLRFYQVLVELP